MNRKTKPSHLASLLVLCFVALFGFVLLKSSPKISPQSQTAQVASTLNDGLVKQYASLAFNGASGSTDTGGDVIGAGAFSLSVWLTPNSAGQNSIGRVLDNGKLIIKVGAGNKINVSSDGGSTYVVSGSGSFPYTTRTYMVITRDAGGVVNIYANGSLSGSANQNSGTPQAGTGDVIIGNTSKGTATFDGNMDDLRIYSRVITSAEIADLYSAPPATSAPAPPPTSSSSSSSSNSSSNTSSDTSNTSQSTSQSSTQSTNNTNNTSSLSSVHPDPTFSFGGGTFLPSDRRIDWSTVGVPGGIINRTTVCANLPSSATAAEINTAITNCPSGGVVYLNAGTYTLSAPIVLKSDITLRGAGAGQTILNYTGPVGNNIISVVNNKVFTELFQSPTNISITGGSSKGSQNISLASTAGISAGDVLLIDQLNDPSFVRDMGTLNACSYCGQDGGARIMGQLVEVTGVSGSSVSFNIPLYWDYTNPALSPRATLVPGSSFISHVGIEDLKVMQQSALARYEIVLDGARDSWVKNVEVQGSKNRGLYLHESYQNQITSNYFHDGVATYGHDYGYGVHMENYDSHNLIDNNIFNNLDGGFIQVDSSAGNVIAYNYGDNPRYDDPTFLTGSPSTNHGPHPFMNLFEGNVMFKMEADNLFGSSSHNTIFRCRSLGTLSGTSNADYAISINAWNTSFSVLGCVLGTPGATTIYQVDKTTAQSPNAIWALGLGSAQGGNRTYDDINVPDTLLRHGNFDYVTNAIQWNSSISDHNLPASLYLYGPPSWWGGLAWPAFGPDPNNPSQLLNGKIPAQVCFENSMGYGSGTFNPEGCYGSNGSTFTPPPIPPVVPVTPDELATTTIPTPLQPVPVTPIPPVVPTPPPVVLNNFTNPLKLGDTSIDVKSLQIFLNTHGFYISMTGTGSPGKETNEFGSLTQKALIRFQDFYQSDVLTPYSVSRGTGYFGVATMKKVNALLGN